MRYIASVSFGKDSTAMLLLIIKEKLPLDEVMFYDTGVEFDEIYKVRDFIVNNILIPNNIKYTELYPKKPFMETMLTKYGWCGGPCRWGTGEKLRMLDKYDKGSIQYVGIAYDEPERYERLLKKENKKAPLYDYKITEKDALQICYDNGIDFGGLYNYLTRVSCWCCRNKNLKELESYKKYLPEYFNKLIELEKQIGEPMKKPKYLEERFKEIK